MMYGASPNELQVIDTSMLREKMTEEAAKEGAMMTESIKMTSYTENGVEVLGKLSSIITYTNPLNSQ